MNLRKSKLLGVLLTLLIVQFTTNTHWSLAEDYRSRPAVVQGPFLENRIARLAASLGIATQSLSRHDVETIQNQIDKRLPISKELGNTWQKLLRIAQSISHLETSETFFPVGYEFETVHKGKISWEEWQKGTKAYGKEIGGVFGLTRSTTFEPEADDRYPKSRLYDEEGRQWLLTTEHVRMNEMKSGYELGTPPVFKATELESMAAFRWNLGESEFGQSNQMTGAHQTYFPFPTNETGKIDLNLAGKVAANLQLLHAQYGPAIHKIVDVTRMGGAVSNFFFRPLVFDHDELLEDFQKLDPKTVTLQDIHKLLFDTHIEKEFEVQLQALLRMEIYEEADAASARKWSKEDKAKFKTAWKYRDTQLKINLNPKSSAPVLLWESRIGDYVANEPEKAMLKTLIDELLIGRAYQLAKEDKIFKLDIPKRLPGETEASYWARLQADPKCSVDQFLAETKVKDTEIGKMISGESFTAVNPYFKAGSKPSFAFEMEGWNEDLVEVVLPRDPTLRKEWRSMSRGAKLKALKKVGVELEGAYSVAGHRDLVTQFYFDFQKFPFAHPELHLEASGNWEVKSSGVGLYSSESLEKAVNAVAKKLDSFGLHLHMFLPDSAIKPIQGKKSEAFAKFLELHSFSMSLQAYGEASPEEAGHWLDSWSLDRYGESDINAVKGHLNGTSKLNSLDQKYHNIAFRPVTNGLDIEIRDIDDDVNYGLRQLKMQEAMIQDIKRMPEKLAKDAPIFMEFHSDVSVGKEASEYTLESAVSGRYNLTSNQKNLLRLFQFEIYKPNMENYMFFKDFSAIQETPDDLLDLNFVRTNYENNIVIPLLNYDSQSVLKPETIGKISEARIKFIDRIYQRLLQIEKDPKYSFMNDVNNFIYLCDYLKRSKHPSMPKFSELPEKMAQKQRQLLDNLAYDLRGDVVRFVQETNLHTAFSEALNAISCPSNLRADTSDSTVFSKTIGPSKRKRATRTK